MNVDIRDAEAVKAIRPVEAALYLRASGWVASDQQAGRAATWTRQVEGEDYEALLPMDPQVRDYALRMGELLSVLSAAERRSQWEVYSDLLTIAFDVTRIRISDPELTDGTLPIEEHAQIAQKARDLVLAAACAATERRPVWHTPQAWPGDRSGPKGPDRAERTRELHRQGSQPDFSHPTYVARCAF